MKSKSTESRPEKPYPDFPLFPHASGRWAKKILGRFVYFGPWANPDAALAKYVAQRDDLYAGRKPRDTSAGVTVRELLNRFLTVKQGAVDSGELSPRSQDAYKGDCDEISKSIGLNRVLMDVTPEDFEAMKARWVKRNYRPASLCGKIQRVRTIFKYAYDVGMIDRPVRFGPGFKRPTAKALRKAKQESPPKFFETEDIRRLLDNADEPMRTMILLGVNIGLGNADIGQLKTRHVNLETAWINFPRPKTAIDRRAFLWPETVNALRAVIASRKEPKDEKDADLVFLTKYREPWFKQGKMDDPIAKEFAKLVDALDMKQERRGFYSLRHTFQTIGDEAGDGVAVSHVMGHVPIARDMSQHYRERISDERLMKVSEFVRAWLFGGTTP